MDYLVSAKSYNYIFYPDLSNKFMMSSLIQVQQSQKAKLHHHYIFSQQSQYSFTALKALMMLSSVFPRRCLMKTMRFACKDTKVRYNSLVSMVFQQKELIETMKFQNIKPGLSPTAIDGFVKEAKHFAFPGFIKHLRLPYWDRYVNISYNQEDNQSIYLLLFAKTSFLD